MTDSKYIDWDYFRFPIYPVGFFLRPSLNSNIEDEEGEGKAGKGNSSFTPIENSIDFDEQTQSIWVYVKDQNILLNQQKNKQIRLMDLNSSQKISRLLEAVQNHRPEFDGDSLKEALNFAAIDHYNVSIDDLILDSLREERPITWSPIVRNHFDSK